MLAELPIDLGNETKIVFDSHTQFVFQRQELNSEGFIDYRSLCRPCPRFSNLFNIFLERGIVTFSAFIRNGRLAEFNEGFFSFLVGFQGQVLEARLPFVKNGW